MRLRQRAARLGLEVQLAKIDDPLHPGETYRCCAYRRHRGRNEQPDCVGLLYRDVQNTDSSADEARSTWRVKNNPRLALAPDLPQLTGILDELPADCRVVELNQAIAAVYWQERGDEASVDIIHSVLSKV